MLHYFVPCQKVATFHYEKSTKKIEQVIYAWLRSVTEKLKYVRFYKAINSYSFRHISFFLFCFPKIRKSCFLITVISALL